MFSKICNRDGKAGPMGCCRIQTGRRLQQGWWQGTSSCVGSGAMLVLLPKCPMCIAAYLALWTGANVAMPAATHLRPLLALVFVASAALLLLRWAATRTRCDVREGT